MLSRRNLWVTLILTAGTVLAWHFLGHSLEWRNFHWSQVWRTTRQLRPAPLLLALGLTYFSYVLRTWRWQLLMSPTGDFWPILRGTCIGFTGMAILGRPGELIRPYYIGRRQPGGISPQLGAWVMERTLDMGTVGLLFGLTLALSPSIAKLTRKDGYATAIHRAGLGLIALLAVVFIGLAVLRKIGPRLVRTREGGKPAGKLRRLLAQWVQELDAGLIGFHSLSRLAWVVLLSLALWLGITLSLQWMVLAYPHMLPHFSFAEAILLMGFTSAGSLLQLPAVGGGMQIVTLLVLNRIFHAPAAVSASAALLIWLISFYAIAPFGLAMAGRDGLSWGIGSRADEEKRRSEGLEKRRIENVEL